MSDFRTVVSTTPSDFTMSLKSPVMTTGSCFADLIGDRLQSFKMQVLANPFGTVYNPDAIHKALRYAVFNEPPPAHTFLQNSDIHFNYDFHSALSAMSRHDLEHQLTETIGKAHYFLKNASWLMITYGTAWIYTRKDTGELVSNCHKMPGALFSKSLLSQKHILESFDTFYQDLKKFNPGIRIILTVSPVRHTKDTLELNSVSKSVLRVSCHTLAEQHTDVEYFPAYEMMMDDLRDYRFYKADKIHPSGEAEDYIWEHFLNRYASAALKDFIKKWRSIQTALNHKPFHPTSAGHQIFLKEMIRKLEELSHLVPVASELETLRSQIKGTKYE
jgi:hypothetical protein